MSISTLAATDANTILTADCEAATLTAPIVAPATTGVPYSVHVFYTRIGVRVEGDGQAVVGLHSTVTLSINELAALGITDPKTLENSGWRITVGGNTFRLNGQEIMIDYTTGQITAILKKV